MKSKGFRSKRTRDATVAAARRLCRRRVFARLRFHRPYRRRPHGGHLGHVAQRGSPTLAASLFRRTPIEGRLVGGDTTKICKAVISRGSRRRCRSSSLTRRPCAAARHRAYDRHVQERQDLGGHAAHHSSDHRKRRLHKRNRLLSRATSLPHPMSLQSGIIQCAYQRPHSHPPTFGTPFSSLPAPWRSC
jgi:hypothetical protein